MIVGLTGGIGSGKSAAANFFKNEGINVIDADNLAKEAVAKDTPGFKKVIGYFGSDIVDTDGSIDRTKLRKAVFDSNEMREALESIVHPLVKEKIFEKISASQSLYSIIEVPLIFETNSMSSYDRVLVIDCEPNLQLERAILRDKSSSETIQNIIKSQCSREERLSIANDVISNNDSLENLQKRSLAMHLYYIGLCKK
tara:strand:+ start:539 stop:1132 length:594 start_codon:yes stop_codon:yes gene_type:complete